jgi:hypothetical protein
MLSPKLDPVVLSEELAGWARRRKTAHALAFAGAGRVGVRGRWLHRTDGRRVADRAGHGVEVAVAVSG